MPGGLGSLSANLEVRHPRSRTIFDAAVLSFARSLFGKTSVMRHLDCGLIHSCSSVQARNAIALSMISGSLKLSNLKHLLERPLPSLKIPLHAYTLYQGTNEYRPACVLT